MHSRSVQNLVLFSQHREHGFRCTWTGLKKMAVHELITVSTATKDVDTFREGFEYFFRGGIYCSEELAHYLLQNACPKLPLEAVNNNKCRLLFELLKKHGLEAFTTPMPSFRAIIHEILNISAKSCDVNEVARNVLLHIATSYEIFDEARGEYQAVISYLTKRRGVDVNDLDLSDFSSLLECLQDKLLHLCSVFSTSSTNVFLHTKLDAKKIYLIWKNILKYLPSNLCSGSVDVIRSFVRNGFDIQDAIFRVDFSNILIGDHRLRKQFNNLLRILEIFMDHGARLNPLPGSNEQPFLHGVLEVHNEFFREMSSCPKLYGFITKCIQRGVDPKSYSVDWTHEDLLCALCDLYDADDKMKLMEYLCDIGAGGSLSRNSGLDLWSRLTFRSKYELARPHFNETLLFLLQRGLRTDCIDKNGNNVLHLYFRLYSHKLRFEGCCVLSYLRELGGLKFWDVLDALLNAGVQLSHVNNEGKIPYHVFERVIPRSRMSDLEPFCMKCCLRYAMEAARRLPVNLEAHLTRVRDCLNRLSSFSHHPM